MVAEHSGVLGALCVLGELCFLFPGLLVSPDAMPFYREHMPLMRGILLATILTTFILGALRILDRRRRRGSNPRPPA